jgi:hypothetical protein
MIEAGIVAAENSPAKLGRRAPVWLLGWALAAAILIVQFGGEAMRLQFADPDNAMWLVSVRDVLDGQGWWDNVQHRLNAPDGTEMHWARWIATAIAAPIAVLTPIVGQQTAEIIVAFAWPMALLAIFMSLIVHVCAELGRRDGLETEASVAGALVAALAYPTTAKFTPGGFDHHSIEILLALVGMIGLLRMQASPKWGAAAGAALALALATAAEGAPFVIAGVLVAGLLWLFRPDDYRRGLTWLGVGLAASSAVFFVLMVPPSRWATPVCDEMSTPFLGFGLAAGIVAIVLGRVLPDVAARTIGGRLAAAAALGGVSIGVLWALFPACAGGGYATMTPEMKELWLAQIAEARSLPTLLASDLSTLLSFSGAAFAGLVAAVFYLRKRWRGAEGWIVLGFLIAGLAIMAWQVRGAFFAAAFAIPFGAWSAVRARQAWKSQTERGSILIFAIAAVASASAAWGTLGEQMKARAFSSATLADYQQRKTSGKACVAPEAYESLTRVERGVIFNSFMLGPSILQRTQHSAIAAPYHRNAGGLMTVITAMRSSVDAAKPVVMETQADYVAVCAALPETEFYAEHPANGAEVTLSARLAAGTPPDWLAPVPLENTPLKLYRVVR